MFGTVLLTCLGLEVVRRTCRTLFPQTPTYVFCCVMHIMAASWDIFHYLYIPEDTEWFASAFHVSTSDITVTANTDLDLYYRVSCGMWCFVVCEFIASANRENDHVMMAVHHFVTLFALICSNTYGYRASGLYILMLHNIVDVPFHILKLSSKLKCSNFVIYSLYILTVIVWMTCKIYLYVYDLCWLIIIPKMMDPTDHMPFAGYITCLTLLILAICHLIWTYMLLRIPFKTSMQEAANDHDGSNK